MKKKVKDEVKYPFCYRSGSNTFIVWLSRNVFLCLSPTKCYYVKQLKLFD